MISFSRLLFAAIFLYGISNATRHEDCGCSLGPTYGWVAKRCNGGYAIRCNATGLNEVPNTFPRYANSSSPCLLDLSENNISHIKNNSFVHISEIKFLLLFHNKINTIHSYAFVNLTSLLFLNLRHNHLRNPTSFGEGVFEPFADMNLTFVSLKHNLLTEGEDLINLFRPLTNMEYFDISYNENLTFSGMRYVLKGLANSSVNAINFNHIHQYFEMGTKLKLEDIEPLINIINVTRIFLDLNKIEVVEEKVFDLFGQYSTLTEIAAGGNRLTGGKYTERLYKMIYVKQLYLSLQHSNIDPFYRQHFEETDIFDSQEPPLQKTNTWQRNRYMVFGKGSNTLQAFIPCTNCKEQCPSDTICLCLPPCLEKVEWRKSYIELEIGKVKVCEPSNLRYLDVSFNLITKWNGPVKGLEQLENLNLADNYCQTLGPFFFDTLYGLRALNVSDNFLGPVFSYEDVHYFRNLTQLVSLDLSDNRITLLPANVFENLKNLKYLDLSRNMISVKSNLDANCLRELDLRENKLEYLPPSLRNYLDTTANLPTKETCNSSDHVTVLLSGNPLRCNCDNRPFLNWLGKTSIRFDFHNNLECLLENESPLKLADRHVVSDLVKRLDTECFPYVSIIVSLTMFLVGIILCVLIY